MARRYRSNTKLRDTQLAEKIRDNLFSDEERHLLTYHRGSLYVDVKEQLLHHYGEQYLMGTEDEIFLAFAQIMEEKGLYGLEKLRVLKERLPYMMIPANFYKTDVKTYTRDQTQSADNSGTTGNTTNTNTYALSTSESDGINRSANVSRAASAANSQETTNLERQMYDGLKMKTFGKSKVKKKITASIENGVLKKVETRDEADQSSEGITPFEGTSEVPHLYAQQSISTAGSLGEASSQQEAESMNLNHSVYSGTFNSTNHSTGHISGALNLKSYTSTEADINVLRLEIPKIRTKFGGVFGPLFTVREY